MNQEKKAAVTGAYSFNGKYIAQRLLDSGWQVMTLTNHPDRPDPFGGRVPACPYNLDNPPALAASLRGVETLYNTYWVRFAYGQVNFEQAVENSRRLFQAARNAGVRRVVHLSVSNPSLDSPLPYFKGKAQVEEHLRASGLSYAILRPTLIYGREDILVNNMAYLLRRFPFFAVPGNGRYRLQPVHASDVGALAVQAGLEDESLVWDAAGPEVFTFDELLRAIARATGGTTRLVHVPPGLAVALAGLIGRFLGDILLTGDEARGLMAGLLVSHAAPRAGIPFSEWLRENGEWLGKAYAPEVKRHWAR